MGKAIINVAIAIIEKDLKYLISQRRSDAHLPGLWEFPGGKQLPDETLEQCVIREVFEELCINIKIDRFYGKFTHDYKDRTVILHAYLCKIISGVPISKEKTKWVSAKELFLLPFPEANRPILSNLYASI
jgi:mutator protein MutT